MRLSQRHQLKSITNIVAMCFFLATMLIPELGKTQTNASAHTETNTATNTETATDTAAAKPSLAERAVKLSGEISAFGELYSVSGIGKRRPSESGRLFFRPRISVFDALTFDFNIMITNEGATARQEINRFGLNPKWKWGQAQVGDFSESYSKFTLNGIRIKGGALTLSPGNFLVSTIGGETQRAVSARGANRAFKRELYGGRIGFGKKGGSGFQIIAFRARDILGSISGNIVDTLIDTLLNDTVINVTSVTPQENIVLGITNNLRFGNGKVVLKSEVAGSAHTRNRQSSELEDTGIPESVTDIFTPRLSSRADFAYSSLLTVRLGKTQLTGGLEYIGPGYTSLGVASLQNDRRRTSFGLRHNFRKLSFRFDGSLQEDNLIDQKLFTTKRNRFNSSITLRPSRNWRSVATVSLMTMNNDAADQAAEIDFTNSIVRLSQTFMTGKRRGIRSINADYTLQISKDNNPNRVGANSDSHGARIRAQIGVSGAVDATLTTGIKIRRRGSENWIATNTADLTTRIKGLARNKLRLSARLSSSFHVSDKVYALGTRADYQIAKQLSINLDLSSTLARGNEEREFDEYAARMTIRRTF